MLVFPLSEDGPYEVGTEEEFEQLLDSAEIDAERFGSGYVIRDGEHDHYIETIPAIWLNPPHLVQEDNL